MIDLQISRLDQIDPSSWSDDWIKLLGAGGVGLLLREIIKQVFARANKGDDNAARLRGDLRAQVAELIERVDVLDARVEAERQRANVLFAENAQLRAENGQLRSRYHNFINWVAAQPGLPTPPPWLYERIEGLTADEAQRRPATGDMP